jgi:hypothetical protein
LYVAFEQGAARVGGERNGNILLTLHSGYGSMLRSNHRLSRERLGEIVTRALLKHLGISVGIKDMVRRLERGFDC